MRGSLQKRSKSHTRIQTKCLECLRRALPKGARETAEAFSMQHTAAKALACYEALREQAFVRRSEEFEKWERTLHLIKAEWDIVKGIAESASAAFFPSKPEDPKGNII